jgi:hypothetical protein
VLGSCWGCKPTSSELVVRGQQQVAQQPRVPAPDTGDGFTVAAGHVEEAPIPAAGDTTCWRSSYARVGFGHAPGIAGNLTDCLGAGFAVSTTSPCSPCRAGAALMLRGLVTR